jgi:hypothetical protein
MKHIPHINRLPLDRKGEIFIDALHRAYLMSVQELKPSRETTGVGLDTALHHIKIDRLSNLTIILRPALSGVDIDHWEVCWSNDTHYIRLCLEPKVADTFFIIHDLNIETR